MLVDRRTDFYSDLTQAQVHAPNAQAGAGLLDDALEHSNPQVTNPEGDLSNLMTALELGYVPQSPSFDPADPVTVRDLFVSCLTRRPCYLKAKKATEETILSCLRNVRGEGLIDKRIGSLSGGELQRVLLALALEPIPNLLILDEPLSGVDVEGMELLLDMMNEIRHKYDLSILMITHDFSMLSRYVDKGVLIDKKVLRAGTPLEVLNSDEFIQAFRLGGAE